MIEFVSKKQQQHCEVSRVVLVLSRLCQYSVRQVADEKILPPFTPLRAIELDVVKALEVAITIAKRRARSDDFMMFVVCCVVVMSILWIQSQSCDGTNFSCSPRSSIDDAVLSTTFSPNLC